MWKAPIRIYYHSKLSVQHGRIMAQRNASGQATRNNKSSILTVGGSAALALVGGSILLAKSSDGFRKFSENYIPGSSLLYNVVLGPIPTVTETKPKPVIAGDGLMKRKLEREAIKKKEGGPLTISSAGNPTMDPLTVSSALEPVVETVPINEEQINATATDANTPTLEVPLLPVEGGISATKTDESLLESPDQHNVESVIKINLVDIDPAEFTMLLSELQAKAADAVNQAVKAQDTAADSIKNHVEMVFRSLERIYEPSQTSENVWEPVFQATQEKTDAIRVAEAKAKEARLAVAQLKEAVAHGLKNDQSKQSPDLITLDESVARALYSLELAKARVEAAESEAKVMDEYRELVNTARRNLQLELSSIRPELAPTFRTEDTKLGEEELNILMAHAYWKIITLQKELAKQQSLEQQRLRGALETQRKEDSAILDSRLRVELERQYYELKAKYGHDISVHEEILNDQFTQQLKRQAAAYTDHLNDSLNMQREELKRKFEGERDLLLAKVFASYHEELAKLKGIARGVQEGLHLRADKDRLSRQVRELWVAAQTLVDALQSNASVHLAWENQRRPLDQSVQALNQVAKDDNFTRTVVETLPAAAISNGVLPQGAIKERFSNVERVCRRVALIDQNGGSLLRYALSYLQSLLVIKLDVRPPAEQDEEIDPSKLNTFDILARTRYHLEKDDLEQALRYMNLLTGEPQNVATDWLKDLRLHLEAVQAARAILAYAAVQAIESM